MEKFLLPFALLFAVGVSPASAQKAGSTQAVHTTADVMPEFKGDIQAYLAKQVNYPEAARKSGKQGRVVVKFVVAENGRIEDAIVERGVDPVLDAEALRAIKAMPNWKPGTLKGKPIKIYYRVPVNFRLA